jgi:hypothetical protein
LKCEQHCGTEAVSLSGDPRGEEGHGTAREKLRALCPDLDFASGSAQEASLRARQAAARGRRESVPRGRRRVHAIRRRGPYVEAPIDPYAPEIYEHSRRIGKYFDLYDDDDDITARFLIQATGPANRPQLPRTPGIESFKGHSFHTSRWDYDYTGGDHNGGLTKLADKRVAIIGTGTTAIQCVPFLGRHADRHRAGSACLSCRLRDHDLGAPARRLRPHRSWRPVLDWKDGYRTLHGLSSHGFPSWFTIGINRRH